MTNTVLTVLQAAEELGLNPETIRRWIWHKKLPATKLGLVWYIERHDLERHQRHLGRETGKK